ncbi:PadR family transcriptional regulator [Leifsonia sp. TF02-11]|uniref:PadR family transcriptional regulator n=1 Tax=Leifsonia sp. TF02-11 TaxID=2815212 RepID=UPI001AA0F047|nr:PadR family transcriptional regulator [Leifsonia sp. TF02-11]MBO1738204.1 helix-turn-helix transcriptional regulator [Leifsonia sp. TF02-11]
MTPAVFAHGSLRLYLLSLLAEEPRHGYELIQALSDRFGGTYVPSAGTIYPRLAKLEEEGLVTKTTDGRKTVYSITDAGRAELAAREHELDAIEEEVTDSVRRLADEVRAGVNDAMRTLRAELASAAREAKRDATRVDPRQEARDAGRDARAAANAAAREAEVAINDFRQELRTVLRSQAARGALPANVVPLLKEELTRVRRTIAEAIGRS